VETGSCLLRRESAELDIFLHLLVAVRIEDDGHAVVDR
jgi:hypothetical protein